MAEVTRKRTNWQKIRKLMRDIHLWAGLACGLIVIAVCFSGTVYVFNTELTERAASHLYKVKPQSTGRISPDSLAGKIENISKGQITSLLIPAKPNRSYQFSIKKEGEKGRGGTTYFVDPYNGKILGNSKEQNGTKEFMSTMFSLHRWLLLDKVEKPIIKGLPNRELGSMITGWATILFTLGCLTGLVIWFPNKVKNWRQGLKIKWKAGWKRVNHDLHNTLAFYALIFLLIMGLTGPFFSFDWYREGLQKSIGIYKEKKNEKRDKKPSKKNTDSTFIAGHVSYDSYIKAANKVLSYEGDYSINIAKDTTGSVPVTISKYKLGFFAPAAADRLTLDRYTSKVTKKEIFKEKPFNERLGGSIKALHMGTVYGTFTKILFFIACLIATSLPITGTIIWLNKLKKRKKRKVASVNAGNKVDKVEEVHEDYEDV